MKKEILERANKLDSEIENLGQHLTMLKNLRVRRSPNADHYDDEHKNRVIGLEEIVKQLGDEHNFGSLYGDVITENFIKTVVEGYIERVEKRLHRQEEEFKGL